MPYDPEIDDTGMVALALAALSAAACADTPGDEGGYTVVFSFVRFGPDGQIEIAGSPSETLAISLPPSLWEWRCERGPQVSRGDLAHQGLACAPGGVRGRHGRHLPHRRRRDRRRDVLASVDEPGERGVIFVGHWASIRNRGVDDGFWPTRLHPPAVLGPGAQAVAGDRSARRARGPRAGAHSPWRGAPPRRHEALPYAVAFFFGDRSVDE